MKRRRFLIILSIWTLVWGALFLLIYVTTEADRVQTIAEYRITNPAEVMLFVRTRAEGTQPALWQASGRWTTRLL